MGSLLTSEMLPVTLPGTAGAKITLRAVVCPGASTKGTVIPLTLKPVPLKLTADMVRLALPELLRVTLCEPLLPTGTFPKLTLAGLALS